jgi:hypothetical protein
MELDSLFKSQPIPTRDLAQHKEVTDAGITESRLTNCLSTSESVQIEDITSSQIQLIDNCEKIFKIVS